MRSLVNVLTTQGNYELLHSAQTGDSAASACNRADEEQAQVNFLP